MDPHCSRHYVIGIALVAMGFAIAFPQSVHSAEPVPEAEEMDVAEPSNALKYTGATVLILGLVTAIPGLLLWDYDVGRDDNSDSPGPSDEDVALAGEISLYIAAGLTGAGLTMLILHGVFVEDREEVAQSSADFLVSPWVGPDVGGVSLQFTF